MRHFLLFATVTLSLVTFVVLWATRGDNRDNGQDSTEVSLEEGSGEAAIGGAFTLTDQLGRKRTDLDFRGRAMLVFFGFTNCRDICPVTVATLSGLMEQLGAKAEQVAPIFITVDPARDTPEVMKAYLKNFDQRIVALTGLPSEIRDVTEAYKAYYAKNTGSAPGGYSAQAPSIGYADEEEDGYMEPQAAPAAHAGHGTGTAHGGGAHDHAATSDSDNYQVDHSGYIYLMDKGGKYVQHFPYNASVQELADALKPFLE